MTSFRLMVQKLLFFISISNRESLAIFATELAIIFINSVLNLPFYQFWNKISLISLSIMLSNVNFTYEVTHFALIILHKFIL